MDELRVSSVSRYGSNFSPPTQYVSDASTMALYKFDDYPISKLPALSTTGPVATIAGVFGDISGHSNSLEQIAWGVGCRTCSSATFYPTSLVLGGLNADELTGGGSPWLCNCTRGKTKYPINAATGEFWHTFNDLSIPGRGMALDLNQTYSSHLASQAGALGYGWSISYGMNLTFDQYGNATVGAGNGSKELFQLGGSGTYSSASWVEATLIKNGDGTYAFTDKAKTVFLFDSAGRLTKETDRNGYATTLSYNASGLATVTDPAGRTLTFSYANGLIQAVSDSGSRTVRFG